MAMPLGAIAATSLASAGPAGAAVRPHTTVTFKGKISCDLSGHLFFGQVGHPTLGIEWSTKLKVNIALSASLSKCKGTLTQGGSTIESGTVKAVTSGTYSCESLISGFPTPSGTVTWTTKGNPAAPTKVTLSSPKASLGPPLSATFVTTATGSFAGTGAAKAVIGQTLSQIVNACKTSPYLRTITINATGSSASV
jgi:hypothetical protein